MHGRLDSLGQVLSHSRALFNQWSNEDVWFPHVKSFRDYLGDDPNEILNGESGHLDIGLSQGEYIKLVKTSVAKGLTGFMSENSVRSMHLIFALNQEVKRIVLAVKAVECNEITPDKAVANVYQEYFGLRTTPRPEANLV